MTINGSIKKLPVQNLVEKVTGIDTIVVVEDVEKAKDICVAAGLSEADLTLICKVFGLDTERTSLVDLEKEYNISHPALTKRLNTIYSTLKSKKRSFSKLIVSNEKLMEAWTIAGDYPEHEKKLKEAELRFANFNNQIDEKNEAIENLNKTVAKLKKKLAIEESIAKEASDKHIELFQEKKDLETTIESLKQKIENGRSLLKENGNKCSRLESNALRLERENEELREKANSGINREKVDEAIMEILSANEAIAGGFKELEDAINKLWRLTEVSEQVTVVTTNSTDAPNRVKVVDKKQ